MKNISEKNDLTVVDHKNISDNDRFNSKQGISTDQGEPQSATWAEILPYFLGPTTFLVGVLGEIYFKNFFLAVWILYVLLPILDYLLPVDHSNVSESRVRALEKDFRFLLPLYAMWLLDFAILFWVISMVS